MTAKNKNELTPLQSLRQEKRRLKALYEEDEKRLSEDWTYLTNNIGHLAFSSIVKSTKSSLLPSLLKTTRKSSDEAGSNNLLNILSLSLPVVWEIAQPILVGFMIKKVKSLFTSKKKKK